MLIGVATIENILEFPQKLKKKIEYDPYDPDMPLLEII